MFCISVGPDSACQFRKCNPFLDFGAAWTEIMIYDCLSMKTWAQSISSFKETSWDTIWRDELDHLSEVLTSWLHKLQFQHDCCFSPVRWSVKPVLAIWFAFGASSVFHTHMSLRRTPLHSPKVLCNFFITHTVFRFFQMTRKNVNIDASDLSDGDKLVSKETWGPVIGSPMRLRSEAW